MPVEFRLGDVISGGMYLDGEKILDIANTYMPLSANEEMQINIETCDNNTRYIYDIDSDWSSTIPLTLDNNHDIISPLLYSDNITENFSISYPVKVQARKHRKRRINKKWLKRYGYKTVMRKSDGWELNGYINGTFEFINRTRGD